MTEIESKQSGLNKPIKEFVKTVISTLHWKERAGEGYTFRVVKYFHPSGASLPNGSHYQKGGFLNECRKNLNGFVLNKNIHGEQYGMTKYRGGMIVFAVNANAVQMSNDRFISATSQFIETIKDHFIKARTAHRTIMSFNDNKNRNSGEHFGAYSLGNFFKGRYAGGNGQMFDDKSICLEINGLSSRSLLRLAKIIADKFSQETVLVKDLNRDKVYRADFN